MLIGNRKAQASGQNWFIVLNPLRSEIDRNKIAKEISKAFRIPSEEAADLVSNTPIILLDSLTYATALQIKQYFRALTFEIVVSNDTLLRRRCYRTVWPTPPSLSFLREINPQSVERPESKTEEQQLEQDEAIQEIRSWVQTENDGSNKEPAFSGKSSHTGRHFKTLLEEERERLLKETVGLRDNVNQIHKALEKSQTELHAKGRILETAEGERKQKEKEAQELRTLVSQAEEKYEMLREEFRQTRHYFEEKLSVHEKKSEEFLRQIEAQELINKELMQEKQVVQKSFHAAKNDVLRARDEREQDERAKNERAAMLARELQTQKKVVAEFQERVETLEESRKLVQTSEYRLLKELEAQNQQAKRWELKTLEFEKEMSKLKESFEGQVKSWQLRLAQLESREHELEKARFQVCDLQQQLANREVTQRQREFSETLTMREGQLKDLVKQQEKLENEIRHREEELRKLLHEQEATEREVVEIKQAQRHLSERMKKEKLAQPPKDLSLPSSSTVFPKATND